MWYESLPTLVIISVCLTAPGLFTYATNRLFVGNPYKRYVASSDMAFHYLRDYRISGKNDPYAQVGLDSLFPDEEEAKKSK